MLNARTVLRRSLEILWALGLVALFALPEILGGFPGPLSIGPALSGAGHNLAGVVAGVAAVLAAATVLWQAAGAFLYRRLPVLAHPDRTIPLLLHLIGSASVMTAYVLHMVTMADRPAYFQALPWWVPTALGLAFAWNVYTLTRVTRSMSEHDPGYREYLAFKQATRARKRSILSAIKDAGIQRRLTTVFSGLILFVIAVLAAVLLSDFGSTILSAVTDNGQALAERAASVIKSNAGDAIAIDDFFAVEGAKLGSSSFPFHHMSFYSLNPRTGLISVSASTDQAMRGQAAPEGTALPAGNERLSDDASGTMEFRSPVVLGGRTIGFVSVVYDRDVIYAPYYRSRVKTVIIAAVFLYASVFFTYLIGRGIVFPILFLRMGVNSLSMRLESMVKGNSRVSAEALDYEDKVGTRDEIKKLSVEIGNMATVIRGVVPYISASTLKHADRAMPTSERREMAFLFTDIRGFTTLCEGRSPEKVVSLLNRYLEIQTKAIIDSGGDVDKFVGDEIMAMFEGPNKEANACKAALAIRHAMAEEQEKDRAESSAVISVGIGINSGPVVFGSVGARDRKDFTSIGDTVNLAARLEGANKTYGTKCLISEAVYSRVQNSFVSREVDLITVKGKTEPVRIYEVLQETDMAAPKLLAIKADFEKGLAYYRKRSWDRAEACFSACAKKYGDEASAVFMRRIALFRADPPPAAWDGVFKMTVK